MSLIQKVSNWFFPRRNWRGEVPVGIRDFLVLGRPFLIPIGGLAGLVALASLGVNFQNRPVAGVVSMSLGGVLFIMFICLVTLTLVALYRSARRHRQWFWLIAVLTAWVVVWLPLMTGGVFIGWYLFAGGSAKMMEPAYDSEAKVGLKSIYLGQKELRAFGSPYADDIRGLKSEIDPAGLGKFSFSLTLCAKPNGEFSTHVLSETQLRIPEARRNEALGLHRETAKDQCKEQKTQYIAVAIGAYGGEATKASAPLAVWVINDQGDLKKIAP